MSQFFSPQSMRGLVTIMRSSLYSPGLRHPRVVRRWMVAALLPVAFGYFRPAAADVPLPPPTKTIYMVPGQQQKMYTRVFAEDKMAEGHVISTKVIAPSGGKQGDVTVSTPTHTPGKMPDGDFQFTVTVSGSAPLGLGAAYTILFYDNLGASLQLTKTLGVVVKKAAVVAVSFYNAPPGSNSLEVWEPPNDGHADDVQFGVTGIPWEWRVGNYPPQRAAYVAGSTGRKIHVWVIGPPNTKITVNAKGGGSFGGVSALTVTTDGAGNSIADYSLTNPVPTNVGKYLVSWDWWFKVAGGNAQVSNTSQNIVYTTWRTPIATNAVNVQYSAGVQEVDYHRPWWEIYDLSCRACQSAGVTISSTKAQVLAAVWGIFPGRSIAPPDGPGNSRLGAYRYWLGANGRLEAGTTRGLLMDRHGRCGSFQNFFIDLLGIQGLAGQTPSFPNAAGDWAPVSLTTGGAPAGSLPTGRTDPDSGRPIFLDIQTSLDVVWFIAPTMGQGGPAGRTQFVDHAIVKCLGQYYDPSYGTGPFPTFLAWKNAAISTFLGPSLNRVPVDKTREQCGHSDGFGAIGNVIEPHSGLTD